MLIKKETELKDVTITHVSYVKRPANQKPFFFAKTADGQFRTDVTLVQKGEDEQRLLYGIVYEPDTADAHGDMMTEQEIEKMAHDFVTHYRAIDHEHQLKAGVGSVVESYIAPVEFTTDAGFVIKKGTWILVTRASDEAWELWKNGEIVGYSMFGIARETVAKGDKLMEKLFKKLTSLLGVTKSFDEKMDKELRAIASDPWFIIDVMASDWYSNIDWTSNELSKDVLKGLSTSLSEAKTYVDNLLTAENTEVAKSETKPDTEPKETPTETEPAPKEEEEAVVEQVEKEEDAEDNTENDELTNILNTMASLADNLNSVSERLSALEKQASETAAVVEEVSKNTDTLRVAVDEGLTQSAFRMTDVQPDTNRPIVAKTVRGAELI